MVCVVPLQVLAALASLCAPALSLPRPHGSGWVPSGGWSTPTFGAASPWAGAPQVSSGWTDYSAAVDPWATQVVRKPSYASLYPWAEKPAYRVHVPVRSYPSHHTSYTGWTRIPVVDQDAGSQWVAWVPEEFGDFVIVRKDKLPRRKIEEEEEEPEEKPKPKKKFKQTIVEEEEPEEEPKPKKKTTIVEEEGVPETKTTKKTTVKEEKKTGEKTTVITEDKTSAATAPEAVTVVAPTSPAPTSAT